MRMTVKGELRNLLSTYEVDDNMNKKVIIGIIISIVVVGIAVFATIKLTNKKETDPINEVEPTKKTVPGLLGELAIALGGEGDGRTVAEQIRNIAVARGFDPDVQPEPVVYTVTYDANGGSGSIEAVEVTAGESITVSDGTGLTAPEGKEFAGWAKTDSAQSATVVSPFTPDKDTTLYAVWVDAAPVEEPAGE